MKKIYKYPTGAQIPEGAVYLGTVTQTQKVSGDPMKAYPKWQSCWLVWHYFLVEVKETQDDLPTK